MPGTLSIDPAAPRPVINVMEFDAAGCRERTDVSMEELDGLAIRLGRSGGQQRAAASGTSPASVSSTATRAGAGSGVLWVDVIGTGDAAVIQHIGELFGLHRLELEDIVSSHQRAKVEDYTDHVYLVMRECSCHKDLEQDQISLCMGQGWVVSFQGKHGDCYEPVRQRIRQRKGRISAQGADYLAYALIDAVVDSYFPALEHLGETLEALEDETTLKPSEATAAAIHHVKRDLLTVRRAVWPAREAISTLIREDHAFITADTRVYLRDCYDHLVQLMDMVETYREIGSGLMDIYLASVSNKMSEVMKVLTIIATIFMPLSFIAGLYGMNFNTQASWVNMPELNWAFGYPFALGLMAATATVMLVYFGRKGWVFGTRRNR